ncbi:MAG: hypothetical protein R6U17_09555 [Thermoplasmata archaeon]
MIGVIKGLVSESEKVKGALKKIEFQVAALPISREELKALKNLTGEDELTMSTPEIAYAKNLQKYGKVKIPPPSYLILLDHCTKREIQIEGIDMDEEHYTSAYCKYVSGLELMRQSMWEKRLLKKKINHHSPIEFALEWDKLINKYKGFRKLEKHREKVMSKNIKRLSRKSNVFSIIELERLEGVLEILKDLDWDETKLS